MGTSSSWRLAPERALARVGAVVGKYRIERLLGIGGMAAVYAATHQDGQRVAIKFVLERFRDEPDVVRLFSRESMIANQVGHPGAVPVLGCDVDDAGCGYLVMPLLEGETLRTRWERANKRLRVSEVGAVMSDVLEVLASAHARGIIHRDIKPENLFVTATGEVRVLDFGIARRIGGDGGTTVTGITIGTPAFMPPEQALGDRAALGPHTDCWAVGATIFTLLSGEFVHAADNGAAQLAAAAIRHARSLREVAPNLPQVLIDVVDRALAFAPGDRWPTAREMRDALVAALETALGEPIADVATRIRVELIADWAREADITELKRSDPAGSARASLETKTESPALDLSGVETNVRDIARALRLVPDIGHRVYVKHGLGHFDDENRFVPMPGPWWPTSTYTACLHEIAATLGPARTFEIQKLVYRYVAPHEGDPINEDIHTAFALADVRFHAVHRKNGITMLDTESGAMLEGIGHIRYRGEPGSNFIAIESDTYAPCDLQRGSLFFIARRYEPHSLVEHAPGPCRKKGDAVCGYHVTWW